MKGITEVQNEAEFDALIAGQTPVLVDFWAAWCGPCRMIAPILGELAEELGDQVRIAKVNVDNLPEIATRFFVQGIPTMILFRGSQELDRMVGAAPKATMRQWLLGRAA